MVSGLRESTSARQGFVRLREMLDEFDERLGLRPEPEVLTLTEKNGFVSQQERFNKRLATDDTSEYKVVSMNDIAFNPYLLWAGAIAQNTKWHTGIISPVYPTFRVRRGYSPRFVNYLLCSGHLAARYSSISHGSVPRRRRASVEDFLNLPVAAPPALRQQEEIANLLDEADELRKLRAKADGRTAEVMPALFHEMFGDVANSSMLGELVEEFRYGTSIKSSGEGKPTLRIPNVIEGSVNVEKLKFVPVSDTEFGRLQLKDGDLLFVRTNGNIDNVGRSAVFDSRAIESAGYNPKEFVFASYLIRARLKNGVAHPLFIQCYLASQEGREVLRARCKTSAGQFNINTEGLGTLPVPMPAADLQNEFAQRVMEIRALRAEQTKSQEQLDGLFKSMSYRAFSGEL